MQRLFAHRALLPRGWSRDVRVTIEDHGRIQSVTENAHREPADTDLGDRVLMPAPCNLHSHAFQRAMAGMTEYRSGRGDSFWTWRELMYRFVERLTPEQLEAIAALVYMEMLEAGYAAVGEFHYIHHQPGGRPYTQLVEMSACVFAAAKAAGIGLTHLPVFYAQGGSRGQPLKPGQARFGNDTASFEKLVDTARDLAGAELDDDARVGIAPHSLRATTPDQLRSLAAVFDAGPIHIHIAEQTVEVEEIEAWLGERPVEWLLDHLDVGAGWCLVHATHMTDRETERMAASGAVAGLCPITEANLGDGIFNGPGFIEAGGALGIGSDSNVRIALAEELRTLEYSQRLRDRVRNVLRVGDGSVGAFLYGQVLRGGAQALGRDAGAIRRGAWADLLTVDGGDVRFHGRPDDRMLDAWVFAADDGVVTDVWAAGRHLVEGGRHVDRDGIVERYRRRTRELFEDL